MHLRTLRLNLNFLEECGAYSTNDDIRTDWWDMLSHRIGWEIVEIVQACPLLEHVRVLYHGDPHSLWVEFHPSRCAPPRLRNALVSARYR